MATMDEYREGFWRDVGRTARQYPRVLRDYAHIGTGGMARLAGGLTGNEALQEYGANAAQKAQDYTDMMTSSPDLSPTMAGIGAAATAVTPAITEQAAMSGVGHIIGRGAQGLRAARGSTDAARGVSAAGKAHNAAIRKLKLARASGDPAKIKAATEAAKGAWQAKGAAGRAAGEITTTPGRAFAAGARITPQFGRIASGAGNVARLASGMRNVNEQAEALDSQPTPVTDTTDRVLSQGGQPATQDPTAYADQIAAMQTQPEDEQYDLRPAPEWMGDKARAEWDAIQRETAKAGDWRSSEAWQDHVRQGYDAYQKQIQGNLDRVNDDVLDKDGLDSYATRDMTFEQYEQAAAEREAKHRYSQAQQRLDRAGATGDMSRANIQGWNRTAGDMQNERMDAQAQARIDAMEDGPDKEEAQAQLADRQANRDMLSPFDRFEGSVGSPGNRARNERLAAYESKLKSLTESRAMTKMQANAIMAQEREIQREIEIAEATQAQKAQEERLIEQRKLDGEETEHVKPAMIGLRTLFGRKGGEKFSEMYNQLDEGEQDEVVIFAADLLAGTKNKMSQEEAFKFALQTTMHRRLSRARRDQSA